MSQLDVTFSIKLQGNEKIKNKIESLINMDFRPELRIIDKEMKKSFKKNFEVGGRPQAWQGYKDPKYRQRKISMGLSPKMLIAQGDMKKSLTGKTRDSIREISAHSLILGTKVKTDRGYPYWKVHQFGGRNHPERQFMGFQEEDKKVIRAVLARKIGALINA